MAKLYFHYGTMNAGKSVELIKAAFNYTETGRKVLVLKPRLDNRGEEGFISCRIPGMSREAILFDANEDLHSLISSLVKLEKSYNSRFSAIFIDEAQFLSKEQVIQLSHFPDYYGIAVLCYGLRTDFQGNLFPGSKALFELADEMREIVSMSADIEEDRKATMVYRVDNEGNPVKTGDVVDIGGNDKYKACSRKEYKKAVMNIEASNFDIY